MLVQLIIPPLGESISEATIAKWLKQVGDKVKTDEPLAELETDKITVTLPSPTSGVLSSQTHPVGATVRIGSSIGTIDSVAQTNAPSKNTPKRGAPVAAAAPAPTPPPAAAPPPPPAVPPVAAAPAPAAPAKPAAAPPPAAAPAAAPPPAAAPAAAAPTRPLTPNARRLLREQGGEPHAPAASDAASQSPAPAAAPTPPAAPAPAPAAPAPGGPEEVVTMAPLRKRIAERLVEAQHSAAILTTFNEVDMSYIQALRAKYQDEFTKKHGIKLGFMSFFVVACARALAEFPGLNAEVRGNDIVYKKYYDFGIAVGSGRGLVVPVLRGADKLGFADIEKGIAALALKAKDNKLTLADLQGGSFSITNGGIYGSMMSTPLLNTPQTGILGMHNIIRRPIAVAKDGGEQIEIRPMMYLAVSYDHRVVDGREAVSFLVRVKERLEQPEKLLLGI